MNHSAWDFSRFLKTLTDFDVIPGMACLKRWMPGHRNTGAPIMAVSAETLMIFDFSDREAAAQRQAIAALWGSLDDVVMGGVSASTFQLTATAARFTGRVSTDNSGGFASVRTRNLEPALDLSGYTGIRLRLQGDGNRYKFLVRGGAGWDSLAHAYAFDTAALDRATANPESRPWLDVYIPFAELVPTLRARTVPQAAPLDLRQIYALQLMLSKFEYDGQLNPRFTPGEFVLDIAAIAAYR
jgi:Complex I intermediate-associated protein 30 (CIA30)